MCVCVCVVCVCIKSNRRWSSNYHDYAIQQQETVRLEISLGGFWFSLLLIVITLVCPSVFVLLYLSLSFYYYICFWTVESKRQVMYVCLYIFTYYRHRHIYRHTYFLLIIYCINFKRVAQSVFNFLSLNPHIDTRTHKYTNTTM